MPLSYISTPTSWPLSSRLLVSLSSSTPPPLAAYYYSTPPTHNSAFTPSRLPVSRLHPHYAVVWCRRGRGSSLYKGVVFDPWSLAEVLAVSRGKGRTRRDEKEGRKEGPSDSWLTHWFVATTCCCDCRTAATASCSLVAQSESLIRLFHHHHHSIVHWTTRCDEL